MTSTQLQSFCEWARNAHVRLASVRDASSRCDLDAVGSMLGDASIVALSEATHGSAEPLEFRNRLFEYLVQEKGFKAIAIESGLVESRSVHDYVRGATGDLETILTTGLSWTFDRLPQNRALIGWLRQYNAERSPESRINFYGFDVPGSPGNARANRGVDCALRAAVDFLDRADPTQAAGFRCRLENLLPNLHFDFCADATAPGYDKLPVTERDALTAAIADLICLLERREAPYTAATTSDDYEWAYRAAIGARQCDQWLRQLPIDWKPSAGSPVFPSESTAFYGVASDIRDRAQADNLQWIINREGRSAKVLLFASRFHLSAVPVRTRWSDGLAGGQVVAGTYLRQRYGGQLVIIGNLIGAGEYCDGVSKRSLDPTPADSLDGAVAEVGTPLFMLDLRTAPHGSFRWLDQEHTLGWGDEVLRVNPARAFDLLLCMAAVTAA